MNILVIDDEKNVRGLIVEILYSLLPSASIEQASNAKEALWQTGRKTFDMIFTDIQMPGMNGLELVEEMHKHDTSTFVVLVSAYCEFTYAHKAIDLRVDKYLLKPMTKEKIGEVLAYYWASDKKRVYIRAIDGNHFVLSKSIIAVEKMTDYWLCVYTTERDYQYIPSKLMHFMRELQAEKYIQVNRRCVVRRDAITRFNSKTGGVYFESGGREVGFECSRAGKSRLMQESF